jgi:hypothetical protein
LCPCPIKTQFGRRSTALIVAIATDEVSKDEHGWYYIIETDQARISLERERESIEIFGDSIERRSSWWSGAHG